MSNYIGNQPSAGEFKKLDSIASSFNGSLTQFDLDYSTVNQSVGDATQLIVSLNGIIQEPGIAYTLGIGGGSIVFASAPASTDTCHIVLLGGVGGTTTPTDGSVTASKLDSSLKDYLEETFTANGSQTTYTLTRAAIGSNSLLLSVDGIIQPSTAYSVAGTTLTISPALPNTTNVRVVHLGVQSGVYIPAADSITSNQLATLNGNLNFDDNAKAVFGEGNDLQIYHDGSASRIVDAGSGGLTLQADANVVVQNSAGTETKAEFTTDGGVNLYHDNNLKLATTSSGIDVTGTATMDGLTIGSSSISAGTGLFQQIQTAGNNMYVGVGSNNSAYVQANGEFRIATGGYQDKVTVTTSGNVGIGTSSPSSFYSLADNLVVGTGTGGNGMTIYSGSADSGYIGFNDTVSASMQGFIQYNHSGDYMAFAPNGAEKMRISSLGTVLVGKISEGTDTDGIELNRNDVIVATRNNDAPLILNRRTSDGDITVFRKDNTAVGSIGNDGVNLTINSASTGILQTVGTSRYYWDDAQFYPANTNSKNLGHPSYQFKDAYLSGGVYLGGTVAANKLDDFEEGTWTPLFGDNSTTASNGGQFSATYVKIGKLVTVSADITTLTYSGANLNYMYGLPFAGGVSGVGNGGGGIGYTTTANVVPGLHVTSNTTAIYFVNLGTSIGGEILSISGKRFIFSLTYETS